MLDLNHASGCQYEAPNRPVGIGVAINNAIDRIATKQQAAPEAMKQAQGEAIQDLQKAGIKVDT